MKITGVRAAPHRVHNLLTGWKMSLGGQDSHTLIFVRIDTDAAVFGVGATSPGPTYISGETAAHHLELLNNVLGPAIVGADPLDLEDITGRMDSRVKGSQRAKAGIDLALHDLAGKALGVPVHKLFGGLVQQRVRVTRLMGMYEPQEMAAKSKALVERGCTALKLKVGTTLAEDVERVQRVRQAVGPEVTITIDFNQACSPKEAVRCIHKMEPYDVAVVEQPVRADDLKGLAYVRKSVRPSVLADESVCSAADVLRIVDAGAADIISLKFPKMGGLLKAKKAAAVCESAGVEYLVGTAPGSRILDAANVHLAVSLGGLKHPCEIGEFERMADDPCTGLEVIDGHLSPPLGPGLGAQVDLALVGLNQAREREKS